MREFIPSDYIDKEGNVYETVGENIREGKNGAVTSEFPTPKDVGNGLIGSDGNNYVPVLKNLGRVPQTNIYAIVSIEKNGVMNWVPVINAITDSNKNSYATPSIKAVVEYVDTKLLYLKNAKTGIVTFSISETGSVSIVENEANLNIYTETGSKTLRILSRIKNKSIIDSKVLKCTTDSTTNFNVAVNTIFSVGNNSLFKEVNIADIKTITLLLSVEV